MDIKEEILLGSEKNIDSVNVDNYTKIELTNNVNELTEFTVNDVVNSSEVFENERNENQKYRIYGKIEWLSLLNGLKISSTLVLSDFFTENNMPKRDIFNSFDFYLVVPSDITYSGIDGRKYSGVTGSEYKKRSFKVIADKSQFEVYNAGFSNNVYGEQTYLYSFNADFDISELFDGNGLPITEMFLYAQYMPKNTNNTEIMFSTDFTSSGGVLKKDFNYTDLSVGDEVVDINGSKIVDIIQYIPEEYYSTQVSNHNYYIRNTYVETLSSSGGNYDVNKYVEWSYNPFIPINIRYLEDSVNSAKAAQIVEESTSLTVNDTMSDPVTVYKSSMQTISDNAIVIKNWDSNSTTSQDWDSNSGVLEFLYDNVYDIEFSCRVFLPNYSDIYIAEVYVEEYVTIDNVLDWYKLDSSSRKFLITNNNQRIKFSKQYYSGDKIRFKVVLLPNPNERRMFDMPDYANLLYSEGRYVWRNILGEGYTDPITGEGNDYPFLNGFRYVFNNIVLMIPPNLSTDDLLKHDNTLNVFDEISYYNNAKTYEITPKDNDDLSNIGKPCQ